MIILLVIVAFDLSFLVRYITRFTEESFAVLISVIFIYEAFTKTLEVCSTFNVITEESSVFNPTRRLTYQMSHSRVG